MNTCVCLVYNKKALTKDPEENQDSRCIYKKMYYAYSDGKALFTWPYIKMDVKKKDRCIIYRGYGCKISVLPAYKSMESYCYIMFRETDLFNTNSQTLQPCLLLFNTKTQHVTLSLEHSFVENLAEFRAFLILQALYNWFKNQCQVRAKQNQTGQLIDTLCEMWKVSIYYHLFIFVDPPIKLWRYKVYNTKSWLKVISCHIKVRCFLSGGTPWSRPTRLARWHVSDLQTVRATAFVPAELWLKPLRARS